MRRLQLEKKLTLKNIRRNNISKEDAQVILNFINDINDFGTKFNYIFYEYQDLGFKRIGSGSSSTVYNYKNYVIKVFNKDYSDSWYSERDAKILKSLQDINIYPRFHMHYKNTFVVMSLVEGILVNDLNSKIRIFNDYDINKIPYINPNYKQVFKDSLIETLKKGYIANDLHEENIILDKNGDFKIIDVGCFKQTKSSMTDSEINTKLINILNDLDGYMYIIDKYMEKNVLNKKDNSEVA